MDADAKREAPSAFARSVGAGAACAVIGVLVCAFTYVARMFDFAPLKAVIVAEDRLYDRLHMPVIHFHDNAKPVVFIDIDDDALAAWPGYQATMTNTPRDLIASLTGEARSGGAAVIYLDFDFRNSLKEDQALAKELENSRTTPVLLPTFFSTSRRQPCETQSDDAAPIELQLAPAFDSLINQKDPRLSIGLVHPILNLGAYGLVEGACSLYRAKFGSPGELVSRQAAMQRAVEIAGASNAASDLAEPKWLPIRWTVGNDVEQKPRAGSDQIAYRRIKAGLFFTSAKGAASIDLKPLLSGAIVIIGTTARFSNDTLSTPVGEIQGALAHVNLALSLESEPGEASLLEQFSIDVVLIILASVATIIWCWRPTYEALAAGERLSLKRRLLRLGRETVVILVCGFVFGLVSWGAIWIFGDIPTGWRFGLLVFAVGAIVVYLIECCSAVASAAEEWAEEFTTAREKRASSRARGAEEGEWP